MPADSKVDQVLQSACCAACVLKVLKKCKKCWESAESAEEVQKVLGKCWSAVGAPFINRLSRD